MSKALTSMDTREGRRDLLCLLLALDRGVTPEEGNARRREFLLSLVRNTGIGQRQRFVGHGTPLDCFQLLVAWSSQFNIDLERIAVKLEKVVRHLTGGKGE